MKRIVILTAAAAMIFTGSWGGLANAGQGSLKGCVAHRQSQTYPWHGGYYDAAWGAPVAVVVPPTAESQTHLGWGVGASASRRSSTSSRGTPAQASYSLCGSAPRRIGRRTPTSSATITSAARGKTIYKHIVNSKHKLRLRVDNYIRTGATHSEFWNTFQEKPHERVRLLDASLPAVRIDAPHGRGRRPRLLQSRAWGLRDRSGISLDRRSAGPGGFRAFGVERSGAVGRFRGQSRPSPSERRIPAQGASGISSRPYGAEIGLPAPTAKSCWPRCSRFPHGRSF